jgi:hypothetical protein
VDGNEISGYFYNAEGLTNQHEAMETSALTESGFEGIEVRGSCFLCCFFYFLVSSEESEPPLPSETIGSPRSAADRRDYFLTYFE